MEINDYERIVFIDLLKKEIVRIKEIDSKYVDSIIKEYEDMILKLRRR